MNKKEIKKLKDLFIFLDADMPSKIFPIEKIKGNIWERDDKFTKEKEVGEYLKAHFLIAFPELDDWLNSEVGE